jgi:hypothetical protein
MPGQTPLLQLPPPLWGRACTGLDPGSLRALGTRSGRGVLGRPNQISTPLPIPPPQGGREPFAARISPKSLVTRWRPGAGKRAVLAGLAWGAPMAALFVALDVWRCEVLCLNDAAATLAVTSIAGMCTISAFAAFFGETAPGPTGRRNRQEGKSWLASFS